MVEKDVSPPIVCPFCGQSVDQNTTKVLHSYTGVSYSDMVYETITFILLCQNCGTSSSVVKRTGHAMPRKETGLSTKEQAHVKRKKRKKGGP